MKNVRVLVAHVNSNVDRKALEGIEGMTFETMDDVAKELGQEIEYYTLSDFMDLCNDSDSGRELIDLDTHWIGYISLK